MSSTTDAKPNPQAITITYLMRRRVVNELNIGNDSDKRKTSFPFKCCNGLHRKKQTADTPSYTKDSCRIKAIKQAQKRVGLVILVKSCHQNCLEIREPKSKFSYRRKRRKHSIHNLTNLFFAV